jgi:acyl-coenzyme A synthetase/AMP-(fatty) acid ligase
VLKAGVGRPAAEVEREVVDLVRERIGPITNFKAALVVAGLPKTRSGKISRSTRCARSPTARPTRTRVTRRVPSNV